MILKRYIEAVPGFCTIGKMPTLLFISSLPILICFNEILKVNVFQDPYLNKIACVDPFH